MNYRDADVRCPFYLRTVPKERKIKCEGVAEGCSTHLAFSSRLEYEAHLERCCCQRYGNCWLFWALKEKHSEAQE